MDILYNLLVSDAHTSLPWYETFLLMSLICRRAWLRLSANLRTEQMTSGQLCGEQ